MRSTNPTPEEVQAAIDAKTPIARQDVKHWMESDNIEVLGAVHALLTASADASRIKPPFRFEEFPAFLLRYTERCLRENPDSDWANNAAEAGLDLVAYYFHLWKQQEIREQEFALLKQWLAQLYRDDSPDLQTRIVQSVLEHLLEDTQIADYFSDWQGDPALKPAYEAAMAFAVWAREHSPIKPLLG